MMNIFRVNYSQMFTSLIFPELRTKLGKFCTLNFIELFTRKFLGD